jgi:hypothetical protein
MYTGDLAKYQMADRMREAQAYRVARDLHESLGGNRPGRVRRIAHGALVAILWPIKH